LNVTQSEIHLGLSPGEALQRLADRCDLEEVRSLASVVIQSERIGSSIAKSMRVTAESLRFERLQRAEEMAYKAGTKMVFPTILCILPAMMYVVAGPALYQIMNLFSQIER
jgi:tight adherence protein C